MANRREQSEPLGQALEAEAQIQAVPIPDPLIAAGDPCAHGGGYVPRYVPVLDPRFSYRDEDVVQTLERVCTKAGYPSTIRVDQGSEFISHDLDLWAHSNGVTLGLLKAGKANGQRVHRGLQRALPRRMLERPLVHEP